MFDTKIAIVVREDLPVWQKLNVTAFIMSGVVGATPCIGYGPRSIGWAHTVDEHVPVDDLVRCAQALALAASRWCGVGGA